MRIVNLGSNEEVWLRLTSLLAVWIFFARSTALLVIENPAK